MNPPPRRWPRFDRSAVKRVLVFESWRWLPSTFSVLRSPILLCFDVKATQRWTPAGLVTTGSPHRRWLALQNFEMQTRMPSTFRPRSPGPANALNEAAEKQTGALRCSRHPGVVAFHCATGPEGTASHRMQLERRRFESLAPMAAAIACSRPVQRALRDAELTA